MQYVVKLMQEKEKNTTCIAKIFDFINGKPVLASEKNINFYSRKNTTPSAWSSETVLLYTANKGIKFVGK